MKEWRGFSYRRGLKEKNGREKDKGTGFGLDETPLGLLTLAMTVPNENVALNAMLAYFSW